MPVGTSTHSNNMPKERPKPCGERGSGQFPPVIVYAFTYQKPRASLITSKEIDILISIGIMD